MTRPAVAPGAPGSLGDDVAPELLLRYLETLGTWRDRRRTELDELDAASLRSPDAESLTSDILLSMALWKAAADRHDLLVEAWGSGRVLEAGRRRMTTLIWGRLDQGAADGNALSVSLPEACRLSDTLAASLRARLRLAGSEPDVDARIRDLRAQVERIRDQVGAVPLANRSSAQELLVRLDRRLVDITERAKRGADVGGLVGSLAAEAATAERDLIIAAATRAKAKNDRARARGLVADLSARGEALRRLAQRCAATVTPAPRLGVPDVTALGQIPADADGVQAYLARLDKVARAVDVAQQAYAAALEERADLAARLDADVAEATSHDTDVAASPGTDAGRRGAHAVADLADVHARAREVLERVPTDLDRLRALLAASQAYLARLDQVARARRGIEGRPG